MSVGRASAADCTPFAEAVRVQRLDSHTYKVNLSADFCIGSVPNGGYTASCLLAAASTHLSSPRRPEQPHTLAAHFEFPGRAAAGPAVIVVEDVKLGRTLSTLHLTLWQSDGDGDGDGLLAAAAPWVNTAAAQRRVLAYATQTNLPALRGMSMPTRHEAAARAAAPLPPLDFAAALDQGGDGDGDGDGFWAEARPPDVPGLPQRSVRNWRFWLPRDDDDDDGTRGAVDIWACRAGGERITQAALAYVVDSFPFTIHSYLVRRGADKGQEQEGKMVARRAGLWFPTVVMNLEVKAALPEEGVEWVALRVASKQMRDGRFDIDVEVRDAHGRLVALGQQVAMILSMERNTKRSATKAVL